MFLIPTTWVFRYRQLHKSYFFNLGGSRSHADKGNFYDFTGIVSTTERFFFVRFD